MTKKQEHERLAGRFECLFEEPKSDGEPDVFEGHPWSTTGQFFIPDIGTLVRLDEDWTFRLYDEYRNIGFRDSLCLPRSERWPDPSKPPQKITIKAGSTLKVDRVYIRKGAKEYSSVTFNLQKGSTVYVPGVSREYFAVKGRFWAKLSDVNRMRVQINVETLARN